MVCARVLSLYASSVSWSFLAAGPRPGVCSDPGQQGRVAPGTGPPPVGSCLRGRGQARRLPPSLAPRGLSVPCSLLRPSGADPDSWALCRRMLAPSLPVCPLRQGRCGLRAPSQLPGPIASPSTIPCPPPQEGAQVLPHLGTASARAPGGRRGCQVTEFSRVQSPARGSELGTFPESSPQMPSQQQHLRICSEA